MTAHHLPPARIQLLQELAHTYGTPLYVYDMPQIARNFTAFKQNFSGRKSLICYALKANSNLSVLRLLAELGSGADCVSIGEVRRALLAGIPAYKIIFSGVGKRDDEIKQALELGILFINVESFEELKRVEAIAKELAQELESKEQKLESSKDSLQKARISIRVNPNIDAKTHPYISTGLHENKFGVDMDSAKQMYLYAHKSAFLEPIGIHFHIGSQLTDLEPLIEASRKIANLARSLVALGINLRFFDIGGGLGIRYEDEKPIDLYAYAQGILSTLSGCDWTIICEPGRRIVGDSGLLLTRVISQKHTESKRFVIVDAGMNDLVRPALYGAFHQPIVLGYAEENSALGSHSADLAHFGTTADHQSCSAPKCAKNYESPTAIPRILEEESQAECETSCREQTELESTFSKVDSSSATTLNELTKDSRIFDNKAPSVSKPQAEAKLDSSKSPSDSKILDEKCGLQGKSQGSYLSGNDCRDFSPLPHFSLKAESPQGQKLTPTDIVGPVCESSDTFCKNIALPPLHNGTLLGFENAGAYGYSMASTYNARMRPAEVGIYADGARLIKSRESFEASVADELALLDSSK